MKTDFYIFHNKFQHYSDRSIDWYIKSWKYKYKSDEWKICRLKMSIYMKESMKNLKKMLKETKHGQN